MVLDAVWLGDADGVAETLLVAVVDLVALLVVVCVGLKKGTRLKPEYSAPDVMADSGGYSAATKATQVDGSGRCGRSAANPKTSEYSLLHQGTVSGTAHTLRGGAFTSPCSINDSVRGRDVPGVRKKVRKAGRSPTPGRIVCTASQVDVF